MTNQLKRSLALLLTLAMLMGVMILTGVASASTGTAEASALGIDAAAAVPQEDAQDTALYDTGDMDDSGEIDATDALMALQVTVELVTPNKAENRAGDVNGDGLIDAVDALRMLQYSVELISEFEVDQVNPDTEDTTPLPEELSEYTGEEYYFGNFTTADKLYVIGSGDADLTIPERFCALGLQGLVAAKGESQYCGVLTTSIPTTSGCRSCRMYTASSWFTSTICGIWSISLKNTSPTATILLMNFSMKNSPTSGSFNEQVSYANACTIAGQEGWLPIDSDLIAEAEEHGLTAGTKTAFSVAEFGEVSLGDATNFEEYDLVDHYGWGEDGLNQDMMIMLGARDYNMRDVGIANGCLFFSNQVTHNWQSFAEKLNPNAVILGWVDSNGTSEMINMDNPMMSEVSQLGLSVVPTDHANNISVYAGLDKSNFRQTPALSNARTDTDEVHYVTMIMEGGTSYSFVERGFVQTQAHLPFTYWNNEARGTIPMGWMLTPMMTDMSPLILNYLYRTASVNDQFIASLSGVGYNYSDILGSGMEVILTGIPALRQEHYKRTGEYMQAADMDYITIMESAPITDPETRATQLNYYSQPEGIQGGFLYYLNGTGYVSNAAGEAGALYWSNNKPFVALRDSLYYFVDTSLASFQSNGSSVAIESQSERNATLQQLAWTLNNRTKDATTIDGYSAISVYQWAFSYNDCVTLANMLDEDVVLVTPGEFLSLINSKVEKTDARVSSEPAFDEDEDTLPEVPGGGLAEKDIAMAMAASNETLFDFATDTGNWSLVAGEGARDNAYFSENSSTQVLMLNMAGTSSTDETVDIPNAMTYNKIAVPSSAKTFAIGTSSASSADIRLLAVDEDGNETVIQGTKKVTVDGETTEEPADWVRISSGSKVVTEWDISSVSGEDTVFYIQFKGSSVRITSIELL